MAAQVEEIQRGEEICYQEGKLVRNWAGTFEARTERFYAPETEEEVVKIVALARQNGKTLRMVGSAHSPSDIHLTSEWMMSLDNLNKVLRHDLDRRTITVQAGMRLYQYLKELEKRGWSMDNLGSISDQSIAGAIATCTHGSSLKHGPISAQVEDITLVLADGAITTCSLENDPDLFRAALVSLGSLGVVIRITMRASQQYQLSYTTETISLSRFLKEYSQIWRSAEYVRAWWWPYSQKVVIWRGDRTQTQQTITKAHSKWMPNFEIGKKVYEASLYALRYCPALLPSFEGVLFRSQFPAKENVVSEATVANPHEALQMDCLFSQYVDEWAVSLEVGIEAIRRLDNWINKDDESLTGIPVRKGKGIFVHAPIEIRVNAGVGDQAYLSPSRDGTAVLYIGVIMYRPYFTPVSYRTYFHAYEHLMRSLGGKPHWAKQHNVNAEEEKRIFGDGMERWLEVRHRVDPTGVFVNGYVKRHLTGEKEGKESKGVGTRDGESGRLYKRFRAVL